MDSNELEKIALSLGAAKFYPEEQCVKNQNYIVDQQFLGRFANAILERAAAESEENPFGNHAHNIRALKFNIGE